MKIRLLNVILVIVLLGLAGCSHQPQREIVRSEKQRVASPAVTETDLGELVAGNNTFASDLYQALREGKGNLFYSPYSISLALAMTYAGARGETEQQMADTLHFTLTQNHLHPAFNGLDLELARRGEGTEGEEGEGFRLNIVNAIWGQDGYEFLSEFLDVLAENYGAGLRLLDFVNAPEESRGIINQWVSDQTESKIEDLITKSAINTWTRLVLTNAIYFNAAWLHPFEEKQTHDGTFHLLDGGQVTVPMMTQTKWFRYAEDEGYQALELPYVGGELAMVILLPDAGRFEEFENSLGVERMDAILKDIKPEGIHLTMPKFTVDWSFRLAETLADMGMPDAFSLEVADFSGMTGGRELFIGEVIHKTFVSVDEAGTEAAAATAVIMPTAAPGPPIEVTVDRPFVFLIRDIETAAILFVGCIVNPSA